MIVIKVELWSAVSGNVTELARMLVSNDGTGIPNNMHYDVEVLRGRSKTDLDRRTVLKRTKILNWPSERLHVWNLVNKALTQLGYKT